MRHGPSRYTAADRLPKSLQPRMTRTKTGLSGQTSSSNDSPTVLHTTVGNVALHEYRATCHWASLDQLALLGAIPVAQRVVHDRGRITGAGVTSGIDFALAVVAERFGPDLARGIALAIEYDPQPPFGGSSPRTSPASLVAEQRKTMQAFLEKRKAATLRAATNLVRRRPD